MPEQITVQDLIRREAAAAGIPVALALAVADQESGFNPTLTNAKGVKTAAGEEHTTGTFQLLPSTAKMLGVDPNDPVQNIRGGTKYLRQLMDQHQGDLTKVLRAYGGVSEGNDHPYADEVLARIPKYQILSQTGSTVPDGAVGTAQQPINTTPMPAKSGTASPLPRGAQFGMLRPDTTADLPGGNPGERFIRKAVIEPVTGLAKLGVGALTDTAGTAAALGNALVVDPLSHIASAIGNTAEGNFKQAGKDALQSVPILSPMAGAIKDDYDRGDVAGALGGVANAAATFLGPKALKGVKASKAIGDVPLLASERTGSGFSQYIENVVERTIPGRAIFQRFRARQQAALQTIGENLAATISAIPQHASQVAERIKLAVDQSLDANKAAASALYDQIDQLTASKTVRKPVTSQVPSKIVGPSGEALTVPQTTQVATKVGGVMPSTRTLKQAALPILRRLNEQAQMFPGEELASTRRVLEGIVNSPKQITFRAFQDSRSDLLKIVRRHGDPLPGKAGGVAKLLAGTADAEMMRAARASGIPGLPAMIEDANGIWRQAKEVYNSTFIKRVIETSPERVPDLMRAASLDDLAMLKQAVPAHIFDEGRAAIMREMLAEATTPPPTASSALGAVNPGVTPGTNLPVVTNPVLNSGSITRAIRRLGPEKAEYLFGRTGVQGLEDLAAAAEKVAGKSADRVAGGLTAAGINAAILAPLLSPFGITFGGFGTSAAAYGGLNLVARVITKPEGLVALRTFVRGMAHPASRTTIAAGMRLSSIVERYNKEQNNIMSPVNVKARAGAENALLQQQGGGLPGQQTAQPTGQPAPPAPAQ